MPTAPRNPPPQRRRLLESKWAIALTSVIIGLAMLIAAAIGGHPGQGAGMLAVMIAFGLLFVVGGRSETIRLMREPDERWRIIDVRATAITGVVLILVIGAAALVELARGHENSPYEPLAAVAGVTYLAALLWQRRRG